MADRSRQLTSAAAALLALAALLAAVTQLPTSLRRAQEQVDKTAGLSLEQRELEPATENSVHEDLALRAAALLPKHAVFYVATGDQPGAIAAPAFYAYWLLPRRRTNDPNAAEWILDFGADPATLPVKSAVAVDLGGGAEVLRVKR